MQENEHYYSKLAFGLWAEGGDLRAEGAQGGGLRAESGERRAEGSQKFFQLITNN